MPEQTVIALNSKSLLFGLDMFLFWDKLLVCLPVIGAYYRDGFILYIFPELLSCFRAPCTDLGVDKAFVVPVDGNPYPCVFFFEATYVCISSISTTSIDSALCICSAFAPKSLIQLYTLTWLTFKRRPMERKPNPSRYNASAFSLSSDGLPMCATVKR